MFPTIMYVLHLEKHKMQEIKIIYVGVSTHYLMFERNRKGLFTIILAIIILVDTYLAIQSKLWFQL